MHYEVTIHYSYGEPCTWGGLTRAQAWRLATFYTRQWPEMKVEVKDNGNGNATRSQEPNEGPA